MACSLEHPNQGLDAPKCPPIQGPESKRDRRSKQEYLSEEIPERIHMQVVTLSWAPAHKEGATQVIQDIQNLMLSL